jgi:hypothetical protein
MFDRVIVSGATAPALAFQPACEVDHLAGQLFRATFQLISEDEHRIEVSAFRVRID